MCIAGLHLGRGLEGKFDILLAENLAPLNLPCYPPVHCGSTRQTASIISMNRDHLRTGDKASCRFRFIKNPEYIRPDTRMVFREGRTKAVGSITKIHPYIPGSSGTSSKQKSSHHHHHHHHHGSGHGRSKGRRGRGKNEVASGSSSSVQPASTVGGPSVPLQENAVAMAAARTSQ